MIAQTAVNPVDKDTQILPLFTDYDTDDVIIVRQPDDAEAQSALDFDALSLSGDCSDSVDIKELIAENGNPFKGFIFATLLSVPVWVLIIWWLF